MNYRDLLVAGAGGVGALGAIAPAFSVDRGSADLFHVTRIRDAETIATQGLRKSAKTPATKQAEEVYTEEEPPGGMEMRERGPTEQAEWKFDELIADSKRSVDGAGKFPAHQPAVFFWPRQSQASESAKSVNWATAIVGVDSSKLPPGCDIAIAPTDGLDYIFKQLYDTFRDHGTHDEQELYDEAKDWWREVGVYDGQDYRRHEVWAGCNVPPGAIEYIENPRTGQILWRPTEKSQATLRDFEL